MAASSSMGSSGSSGGSRPISEEAAGLGEEVRELGQHAREIGQHAKHTVKEKLDDVRRGASDLYSRGKERANEAVHGLERYVQEQPIKSLLIAAGAGVILGALCRRR